mgnify:CR=1 FL=1
MYGLHSMLPLHHTKFIKTMMHVGTKMSATCKLEGDCFWGKNKFEGDWECAFIHATVSPCSLFTIKID